MNLLVLSHLVDDSGGPRQIERTLRLFGARLDQMGRAVPMMAAALSTYVAGPQQIVIVGHSAGDNSALEAAVAARYSPFSVTLSLTSEQQQALASTLPFLGTMHPIGGKAAAYVCANFTCRQPVTTADALNGVLT